MIVVYFGLLVGFTWGRVAVVLAFSLIGMAGSYGVAWFGIRVNTLANSRTAFASLRGRPLPMHRIPMKSGMSIGMVLISVELIMMLVILLFVPSDLAGACFIGFAIGESLGAAALRIAGGIFTKIADIGSDLMKIAFKIKEDDARNPGVIADCVGDNAGDSVGPSADGFETYGVTGVALITFILLGVQEPEVQASLLVWLFVVRAVMVIASAVSYLANDAWARAHYANADRMNFETPLSSLVWVTSIVSIVATFATTYVVLGQGATADLWWKLAVIVSLGTLAGALIPELVKVFTSTKSKHVREVVKSSRQGGASLNILSGLVAGNFSAYWLGITIVGLMSAAALIAEQGLSAIMLAPAVFAFGLVAFGFLSMGPVTIAVDSYGPVTDNAQSVYELSMIEDIPGIDAEVKRDFGFDIEWDTAKLMLEENDGAGNTFKATAKPVLIGTAVVGATTMIFSIIMSLTEGLTTQLENLSVLYPPFLLGLITGGAIIYWFTGASIQAVTTGAYRAVEFIKTTIKLDGADKASEADSRKVVEICTQYAQQGMINMFLGRLLRDSRVRLRRAVLLHRLPDLHRGVRPLPGDLHGGRGRRLGQRQEDRRDRPAREGHGAARRDDRGRHRGRSLQGHVVGGPQPGHQVHHAVRPARRRAGGQPGGPGSSRAGAGAGRGLLPRSRPTSCTGPSTACGSSVRWTRTTRISMTSRHLVEQGAGDRR